MAHIKFKLQSDYQQHVILIYNATTLNIGLIKGFHKLCTAMVVNLEESFCGVIAKLLTK